MSFTSEIKQEVSYNELKECCKRAELSALLQTTSSLLIANQQINLLIKSENPTTMKRILILLKSLYNVKSELVVYQKNNLKKNNIYEVLIKDDVISILENLGIYDEKGLTSYPRYEIVRKSCCARAYIAGAFIAKGSCNSPAKSNYHLEITANDEMTASFIIRQLKRFNIDAKMTKRRGKNIVYLKKVDAISDFLRCIGAHESLMKFENSRISRDFNNSLIRLDNCVIANAEKSIEAAHKQLDAISLIERNNYELDQKLQRIVDLRKKFPEESLSSLCLEYSKIYHENISRSGLKHRFDKVIAIAKELFDD